MQMLLRPLSVNRINSKMLDYYSGINRKHPRQILYPDAIPGIRYFGNHSHGITPNALEIKEIPERKNYTPLDVIDYLSCVYL